MVMEDITKRTPENAPKEPKVLKRYSLDIKTEIEVRDDGVFLIEQKVTKEGKAYEDVKPIASSVIDIVGLVDPIDADDEAALLVHIDGRPYTVSRDALASSQDIARWLAARSAYYNPSMGASLARMFMETRPDRIIGYTRNGWAKNGAFVVGDHVMMGEGVAVRATDHKRSGTFDDWEREVLARAHKKPMWLFAILVGRWASTQARRSIPMARRDQARPTRYAPLRACGVNRKQHSSRSRQRPTLSKTCSRTAIISGSFSTRCARRRRGCLPTSPTCLATAWARNA
jgi:hypothetical protein